MLHPHGRDFMMIHSGKGRNRPVRRSKGRTTDQIEDVFYRKNGFTVIDLKFARY